MLFILSALYEKNLVRVKMTMVEAPGVFALLPKYLLSLLPTSNPDQRPFDGDRGKGRVIQPGAEFVSYWSNRSGSSRVR
jgi:hypothetical protein